MSNIYFLNPIMHHCDWFVSPQSDIGIPGFNFPAIFKACNDYSHVSPKKMAELFVHSFYDKDGLRYSYSFEIEETAVFAVNPAIYEKLIPIFKTFIASLTSFIKADNTHVRRKRLINARQKNLNFLASPLFFRIDLQAWIKELVDIFPNESFILDFQREFEKIIYDFLPYSYKGKMVKNFMHKNNPIDNKSILPCGISIHYPLKLNTQSIDELFSGSNQLSFPIENDWWVTFYANDFPVPNW
jgi:hypothetical protein